MILENISNIKEVKIYGSVYSVEETIDTDKLRGENEGFFTTGKSKIYIKSGLSDNRKSSVLWHEILHAIDYHCPIKSDESDLTENEIQRIVAGLQSLEFIHKDNAQ